MNPRAKKYKFRSSRFNIPEKFLIKRLGKEEKEKNNNKIGAKQ